MILLHIVEVVCFKKQGEELDRDKWAVTQFMRVTCLSSESHFYQKKNKKIAGSYIREGQTLKGLVTHGQNCK